MAQVRLPQFLLMDDQTFLTAYDGARGRSEEEKEEQRLLYFFTHGAERVVLMHSGSRDMHRGHVKSD